MNEYREEVKIIEYDNKRIYGVAYFPKGEGPFPIVIFNHGYNGSNETHAPRARLLAKNGIASYCYDFCDGSVNSKSSMKTTDMTIFTEEDDLKAVINNILKWDNIDNNNIFLFGESQGGLIAALTCEDYYDKIRAMILLFPAFCIPDVWTEKFKDINKIPEEVAFLNMNMGRNFVKTIHGFNTAEHIGNYKNNVLIMQGDKDPVVEPKSCLSLAKKYKNSKIIVFPGERHGFSEKGNEKVKKLILQFVKENII